LIRVDVGETFANSPLSEARDESGVVGRSIPIMLRNLLLICWLDAGFIAERLLVCPIIIFIIVASLAQGEW
jgi:hypothetical protein